jgi:hypothetical protein
LQCGFLGGFGDGFVAVEMRLAVGDPALALGVERALLLTAKGTMLSASLARNAW